MGQFGRRFNEPLSFNRILRHTESGLMARIFDCVNQLGRSNCRASKVTIFESLKAFVEEYLKFADLCMANFRLIFLYFFLFNALVTGAFGVHHLVKCIKRNAILIRSRIDSLFNPVRSLFRFVRLVNAQWCAWLREGALTFKQRFLIGSKPTDEIRRSELQITDHEVG